MTRCLRRARPRLKFRQLSFDKTALEAHQLLADVRSGAEMVFPPNVAFLEHNDAVVKGDAAGRPGKIGRLQLTLCMVGVEFVD